MFCKQCGAELSDDTRYCTTCGSVIDSEQSSYVDEQEIDSKETKLLTLGILATVFAWATCVPFVGIILGAKAGKLVNEIKAIKGEISGKAKAGEITGKIGLIAGIVMTVVVALIFMLYGCLFCAAIISEM